MTPTSRAADAALPRSKAASPRSKAASPRSKAASTKAKAAPVRSKAASALSTAALSRKVAALEEQLTSLRAETEALRSNGSSGFGPGTMAELGAALDDMVVALRAEAQTAFEEAVESAMDRVTACARERMSGYWVEPPVGGTNGHIAAGSPSVAEPTLASPFPETRSTVMLPVSSVAFPTAPQPVAPPPPPTVRTPVPPPSVFAPMAPLSPPTRSQRPFLAMDAVLPMIAAVIVLMVVLAWVA